jgi:transcriptional regulator with XRE-family HTH domain
MASDDFYCELMSNLIYWRKERGLDQADVANHIGCIRAQIANMETLRSRISAYQIMLWCDVCRVNIADVWPETTRQSER